MATNEMSKRDVSRLQFLDGARALAALFVVVHHSFLTIYPQVTERRLTGVTGDLTMWMFYGHFAVTAFLVISGYSLAIAVSKNDLRLKGGAVAFMRKRLRRIVPPYIFALALSALMALTILSSKTGTHWDATLPLSPEGVVVCFFLMQDVIHVPLPNHAFWSLATEWHIYFAYPLMLLVWRRYGLPMVLGLTTLVAVILQWYEIASGQSNVFGIYVLVFLVGVITCYKAPSATSWKASFAIGVTLIAAVAAFISSIDTAMLIKYLAWFDVPVAVVVGLLLRSAGANGPVAWSLNRRWLIYVGGFSYSIYLIHAPLVQLFWQLCVHPFHLTGLPALALMLFVGIPVIVAASWVFFMSVERHYLTSAPPRPVEATDRRLVLSFADDR